MSLVEDVFKSEFVEVVFELPPPPPAAPASSAAPTTLFLSLAAVLAKSSPL